MSKITDVGVGIAGSNPVAPTPSNRTQSLGVRAHAGAPTPLSSQSTPKWERYRQPESTAQMVGCAITSCGENARWRLAELYLCHEHQGRWLASLAAAEARRSGAAPTAPVVAGGSRSPDYGDPPPMLVLGKNAVAFEAPANPGPAVNYRALFEGPLRVSMRELVGAKPTGEICRAPATCTHVHVDACPVDCPHVHADPIDDDDDLGVGNLGGQFGKVPLGLDGAENRLGAESEMRAAGGSGDKTDNGARDGQGKAGVDGQERHARGNEPGRETGRDSAGQVPRRNPVGAHVEALSLGHQNNPVVSVGHGPSVSPKGCGVWIVKVNGHPEVSCGEALPAFVHGFGAVTLNPMAGIARCRKCEEEIRDGAVAAEIHRDGDTMLSVCARCRHLRVDGESCQFCMTNDRVERLAVKALQQYERQWTELAEKFRERLDGAGLERPALWREFWKVMAECRLLAGEQRAHVLNEREAAGNLLDEVSDQTAARS